jgi:hypothetical protein
MIGELHVEWGLSWQSQFIIKSQCISAMMKGWDILLFSLVVTLERKSRVNALAVLPSHPHPQHG